MIKKWSCFVFGGWLFLTSAILFSEPVFAEEDFDPDQTEEVALEEDLSSDISPEETHEMVSDTDQTAAPVMESVETDNSKVTTEQKASRTILLYDCGANLETEAGMASYNLRQILASSFSKDDNIRFIVMTGGSDQWHLESDYLCDPYGKGISVNDEGEYVISTEYNQIWEAKGVDSREYPVKLVLLDADGITGDGENALKSEDELMVTPDTLKGFINYGVENFPAEKYDLILWDHGMGPSGGFGGDDHDGFSGQKALSTIDLLDVFADNAVTKDGGKFDFVNFDACLMSGIELILPLTQYTDYYIASPELVPGYGQYYGPGEGAYTGWLDQIGKNPDMDTFEIGKIIVDDFIQFYEEGAGSAQEGTLSVIDMNKLINYDGITDYLKELFNVMDRQLSEPNEKGLYPFYDELSIWKDAIKYGKRSYNYYDLGGLASKLAMEYKEIEPEDIISDTEVNYANNYMEVSASLNWILHNDTTVYERGTSGIRSVEQYYRDANGQIVYGALPTSGVYITFFPSYAPENYYGHYLKVKDIVANLPDGEIKDVFNQYYNVTSKYVLISTMGRIVSRMVDDEFDKSEININTVRNYTRDPNLIFYDPTEGVADVTEWNLRVQLYINILTHAGQVEDDILAWLDGIVRQQAEEAVLKKNIHALPVSSDSGTGYQVIIEDTRKRVIDRVQTNIIAELPSVIDYLNDPANADIADILSWSSAGDTEFPIGIVEGKQNYDAGDPGSVTAKEYVQWYLDSNSNWELEPFEEKWYAVQDAEGTYHVVLPEIFEAEDEAYFLVMYHDDDGNEKLAYLDFYGGKLNEIYLFADTGGYRSILPKDIIGEFTVTPITQINYYIGSFANVPISMSSFTITADNADQIRFVYTDISNIPDIADTDGDGDVLTRRTVVTDIYGYQFDISNLMIDVVPISIQDTDISGVEDKDYTGYEIGQELVIMDGDTLLIEGQDYEVTYVNNIDAGTATIIINGKGKYIDSVILTFKINKAESTICIEPQEVFYNGNAINYQKTKPSVNTGVETNFILWLTLMAGASFLAGASGFALRKKKD